MYVFDAMHPFQTGGPLYFVFFVLYMLIGAFGILNLLTAVFIEQLVEAQETSEKNKAIQKRLVRLRHLESLREVFKDIDKDGSGYLSQAELSGCLALLQAKDKDAQEQKKLDMDAEDSVFDILEMTPETFHELLLYFASDAYGGGEDDDNEEDNIGANTQTAPTPNRVAESIFI